MLSIREWGVIQLRLFPHSGPDKGKWNETLGLDSYNSDNIDNNNTWAAHQLSPLSQCLTQIRSARAHKIDIAVASLDPILSAFSHNQSVKISSGINDPANHFLPKWCSFSGPKKSNDSEHFPWFRGTSTPLPAPRNIFIEFKLILTL